MWINSTKENPKAPDINFVVSDKTNQNKEWWCKKKLNQNIIKTNQ
jgi:hypothetical protein